MFTVCFIWRKDEQMIGKIKKEIIHYSVLFEERKGKMGTSSIIGAFRVNRAGIEPQYHGPLVNTVLIRVMAYLHTIYFQDENHTEDVI